MRTRAVAFGTALGTILLQSCASGPQIQQPSAAAALAAGTAQGPQPGETVRQFDLNQDRKPDVWKYYRAAPDGQEVLVRKESDINFDGKVDIWTFYDDKGDQVVMDRMDLDFDGRVDNVNYYAPDGKRIRQEIDLNFDEKPDIWKYFEKDQIVRKERDMNSDGRVDYWEYYTAGEIDRVGVDTDGDGTVDQWQKK